MKMSIIVPVGAIGVFAAAMAFASPEAGAGEGVSDPSPTDTEALVLATCADVSVASVSQATGWHNALGSKRAQERAVTLAAHGAAGAEGCDLATN